MSPCTLLAKKVFVIVKRGDDGVQIQKSFCFRTQNEREHYYEVVEVGDVSLLSFCFGFFAKSKSLRVIRINPLKHVLRSLILCI